MACHSGIFRPDYRVFRVCVRHVSTPLPTLEGLSSMPWWAPLGGLVGAVQVYAGLTLVNKVGAGPFVGFTVTAALMASLVVDHYGLFHMPVHAVNVWRIIGSLLMSAASPSSHDSEDC
jgi:uncharacterized membrane protein YdcZ (DUF606 family)